MELGPGSEADDEVFGSPEAPTDGRRARESPGSGPLSAKGKGNKQHKLGGAAHAKGKKVAKSLTGKPSKPTAVDKTAVSVSLVELVNGAHVDGAHHCICLQLDQYAASELVALARSREFARRANGEDKQKLPGIATVAISHLCKQHLFNEDAVKAIVVKVLGPKTLIAEYSAVVVAFHAVHAMVLPPIWPAIKLSVFQAYLWYLICVLPSHHFAIPSASLTLFTTLRPHLLRDLVVNHNWHLVAGNYRIGAMGTGISATPMADCMAGFSTIMVCTMAHYTGDHSQCGLSLSFKAPCANTIDVAGDMSVIRAGSAAALKVCQFISINLVDDIHSAYPNQDLLHAHFVAI